jgi:hypothetical protein
MTAGKPPDKTLVGMPSDLQAVLQKLEQAGRGQGAAPLDDLHKTRVGQPLQDLRRTVPPPLPAQRSAATPPASAPAPDSPAGGVMDRTLIGMAPDMQAALQRALAEHAAAPPQSAPPAQPAAARPAAFGASTVVGAPLSPAAKSAPRQLPPRPQPRPSLQPPALPRASTPGPVLRAQPVRAVGGPSVPASEPQVAVISSERPSQPVAAAPPPAAEPARAADHMLSTSQAFGTTTGMKMLAAHAPLDWPPAARSRGDSERLSRAEGLQPVAAQPSAAPEPEPEFEEQPADEDDAYAASDDAEADLDAQDAQDEEPVQPDEEYEAAPPHAAPTEAFGFGTQAEPAQRLALPVSYADHDDMPERTQTSARKPWLKLVLAALGMVGVGAFLVLRAPHWLPDSVAARLAPPPPPPAAAVAPPLPAAPPPERTTDVSAATDPIRAFPAPARPPAAPAMTSGASAQLEKKAIERLIANDYAAAKSLYERLQSVEPSRPEFAAMVELLKRNAAAGAQP